MLLVCTRVIIIIVFRIIIIIILWHVHNDNTSGLNDKGHCRFGPRRRLYQGDFPLKPNRLVCGIACANSSFTSLDPITGIDTGGPRDSQCGQNQGILVGAFQFE